MVLRHGKPSCKMLCARWALGVLTFFEARETVAESSWPNALAGLGLATSQWRCFNVEDASRGWKTIPPSGSVGDVLTWVTLNRSRLRSEARIFDIM